jgi:hypothetical protein
MREKEIKEGLGELADMAERDHEVQMARADLYKLAKYAIKLHDMLKQVSEAEGLEGWQQSKITKASDYISSVYHNLDYKMKFGEEMVEEEADTEESVEEGKFKSDAQRKAIHAAKASGKRSKKSLRKESLEDRLAAKLAERSLSKGEEKDKEKYVKGMKKAKGDFKDRYGKDAEAVMYATATKMAKK